jgi:hypothetical protein
VSVGDAGSGHQGRAETSVDELEHEGVVGDLDRRRVGAEDAVDGVPDAPAGREPQDGLVRQVGHGHAGPAAQRVVGRADEDQPLADQWGEDDPARPARSRIGAAGDERDVHRAVQDRAQVPGGTGQRLAQLDDDARVAVAQVGQDRTEVERAGAEGAAQDDGAANLARDRRDVVAGRLHGVEYALGGRLQGRPVLGDRDRRDRPVEQGHAEFVLEARDRAGHGRLDDVNLAGGSGEAPGLATGEEVVQVTDLHGFRLRLTGLRINGIDGTM